MAINFDIPKEEPISPRKDGSFLHKQFILPKEPKTYRNGSKTKFSVGDKVRVRSDLVAGRRYKMDHNSDMSMYLNYEMYRYLGEIITIESIVHGNYYRIKEHTYTWTDEMFEDEPVEVAE